MNKITLYKKWKAIFVQRQESDGSIHLYPEDQRELLDDILNQRITNFNFGKN